MNNYKLKMKNFCDTVGANLRVRLYSGQPQGIVPTNASKIFIPASVVAKFFDSSFFIYNFSFYITMEQLISGVFGAMVPEREISQFSNPLAVLRPFGLANAVSNLSKSGRGVYYRPFGFVIRKFLKADLKSAVNNHRIVNPMRREYSPCLLFQRLLKYLPAAGRRDGSGVVGNQGTNGNYWSSTAAVSGTSPATRFNFSSAAPSFDAATARAYGCTVRCVQRIDKLLRLYDNVN